MRIFVLLLSSLVILTPPAVMAQSPTNALGKCMTDNTTGKDRKVMARWMFLAMSAHPENRDLSMVTEPQRIEGDKQMAALVTRLITIDCVEHAKAARAQNGQGMGGAFGALGEVAMMELTAHPDVAKATTSYGQFLNSAKFKEALKD